MMLVPSVLNNWAGPWEKESLFVAGSTPRATEGSFQDAANSPHSAIKHRQAAERDRQQIEVLVHQLALAREDIGTLTARVTALTDAPTEAEKTLQTAQASAAEQKQAAEQERQRGEVLAHQLASAREDIGTLTARVTALTDARTEADKALQTAQASAAEQKLALEQERQRGDAVVRELASAREEVENRQAAANAARASAAEQKRALEQERERGDALARDARIRARGGRKSPSGRKCCSRLRPPEQKQAAEQERQRGEVLARQLASAREDVGTLTARVTALTDARTEAEKALQTAQASAAEQKLALEQERERGDALVRELASAREEVEARKAAANAADASAA